MSAICLNLDQSKILLSGNGLKDRIVLIKDYIFSDLLQSKIHPEQKVLRGTYFK